MIISPPAVHAHHDAVTLELSHSVARRVFDHPRSEVERPNGLFPACGILHHHFVARQLLADDHDGAMAWRGGQAQRRKR